MAGEEAGSVCVGHDAAHVAVRAVQRLRLVGLAVRRPHLYQRKYCTMSSSDAFEMKKNSI